MKTFLSLTVMALSVTSLLLGTGLAVPLSEADIGWFRESPLHLVWGKDPFVPKVRMAQDNGSAAKLEDQFILTAVLLGRENPAAILNGSVVQVGDRIDDYKVARITRKSIFLKGPSGTTEIPLKPLFSVEGSKP